MVASRASSPPLLQRLLNAPRGRGKVGDSHRPAGLTMICPRCRLPMQSAGSSAEERLDGGLPYLLHRWRCSRCRTGAAF